MRALARCVCFIVLIGVLKENARGDGKFYYAEGIPAGIPYQRAFLIFNEGSEKLVLQSKYEISHSAAVDSLGWVVPVPAVPEVASADAETATRFFFVASLRSKPEVTRISRILPPIAAIFFFGCIAFLLVLLAEYPFLNKIGLSKAAWRRRLSYGLIITSIVFVLLAMTPYHLGHSFNVEIVKAEKAGIYDVKVIRSENADAILGWLKENGFGFNDSDVQVFKDYVDKGWCFVVAKVEQELGIEEHKIVSEGLVAPLILKFKTNTAVYPLAITSTIGADTEVLLYTLSDKKLSCNERLTLRRARKTEPLSLIQRLQYGMEPEAYALLTDVPKSMILCKFKKRLKPEDMKQDIEFEFATDDEPYAEKIIVW